MSHIPSDSIKVEQLRLLYEALPLALFATLVNALLTALILWDRVPTGNLLAWLGAFCLVVAVRYAHARQYRAQTPYPPAAARWGLRFYAGVAAAGLLWGGSLFVIFPQQSIAHQLLLTLVIAGTCAGAVSTLSYQWQAIALFLLLTLLPTVLRFALQDGVEARFVAIMTGFFLVMMLLSSRRIYGSYRNNLLLRQEAEASELRFRNLLQATPDALLIVDDQGRIDFLNRRAVELFGYAEDELLGQSVESLVPPARREQHAEYRAEMARGGQDREMKANRNIFARRKDGSEFPADVTLSRLDFGGVMRTCAAVRDVTERWEAEQVLRKAKMAAESANQAKSSFLSAMSHELRTPLNAILGFSQLMRGDANLTATQRENIGEIILSGEHLLKLINDVLDLSRIEAGRMQFSIEPIRVGDLINTCLGMIEPAARHRGIAMNIQIDGYADALVRADRTRLLQILLNLLSNAVKYNHENGSVVLACERRPGDRLRFSIADTGPGISPEKQHELFVPFSRLGKEFSNVEGTGIGLVLSKQIVEIMNGELGFSSELGRGTTFWVDLPYLGQADTASAEAGHEKVRHSMPRKVTLLYIEDNPVNQRLLGQMLTPYPQYRLLLAGDPGFGLHIAREAKPDLILLDVDLPMMNGFQVAERMKADAAIRHIPIIAVSARDPSESPSLLDRAMFESYIAKPVDKQLLFAGMERVLGLDQAERPPA